MFNMTHHNEPLNDSFLKALEQGWGFYLPKGYRDFLLQYNGGESDKRIFDFKNTTINDGSDIRFFFGISKGDYNLLSELKSYKNRIPNNCFPIGCDSFGNLILISVKNKDRGKIYFWDHEAEVPDGEIPDYSNLTLISDSFEEFIASLKSDDDIDITE